MHYKLQHFLDLLYRQLWINSHEAFLYIQVAQVLYTVKNVVKRAYRHAHKVL